MIRSMSQSSPITIELRGVTKVYGRQSVLTDASMSIARGELVVVVGRSGSGKSTLLRLIGGLETPDRGNVLIDGSDVAALTETARARLRRCGARLRLPILQLDTDSDRGRERGAAACAERRRPP